MSDPSKGRVHREVRFGSYILGSTLGEGEFGKVKLGWRKDGKQPSQVAIKLIKRENILKNSESEIKIHREINSLKLLNHPNIVKLVEVMKSGKYIGIVLEYASGGELFDYILHHKYLKEDIAKRLFAQLVSGIDYMHSKGLVHRDLKLENLLLDKHKNIIISDFGFVNSFNKDKHDYMKTSCGSPCYAAPELVLTQTPYEGRKVDIWSLGVILYAMLAGYLPFDDDPDNEDGNDIVKLYHYICKTPLTFPEYITPLARDLLRKIIVPDPRRRININDIRSHPWLTQHVNLLSIRQPEWDRIHKENKDPTKYVQNGVSTPISNMYNHNKRFSMVNEHTSNNETSFMMMSKHGKSYSSANVVGQLYSNPSAPTTTSSLANAIVLPPNSSSSSSTSTLNAVSSSSNSRGYSTNTTTPSGYSSNVVRAHHGKSASISSTYSSASIALKAMVPDMDINGKISSGPESPSSHQRNARNLPQHGTIPRSTTYTGGAISTIVESPVKDSFKNSNANDFGAMLPPPNRESNKLPAHKKPRPTSYHPSSITSSLTSGGPGANVLLDYLKMPSPTNGPIPFLSTSPTKSIPEIETSPMTTNLGIAQSRRNSVVTPINVTGVLSNDENKRNSMISYLEDKIESMDLQEAANAAVAGPSAPKVIGSVNSVDDTLVGSQKSKASEHLSGRTVGEQQGSIKSGERAERERDKENKKRNRFSLLSFYSYGSEKAQSPSPPPPNANAHRRTQSVITTSNHSSRKVLEPSNEVNILKNTPQLSKRDRVSSIASSRSAQSGTKKVGSSASSTTNKEASAARKVMDFFKRRSMRVN